MRPYVFTKRNSIHIVDIRETVKGILRAKKFLTQVVGNGGDVLYVGTKRQARDAIKQCADSVGMPYVADRWLGGTLTNFRTIRSRLGRLEELEAAQSEGRIEEYSKKQRARMNREYRKISRNLSGIRNMARLPGALIVIDVHREHLAVREARGMGIPTICLIDTDSDPDFADIPIPGNDDAMRSIDLVLTVLTEAVQEGLRARKAPSEEADASRPRKKSEREPLARASSEAEEKKPAGEGVEADRSTEAPGASDVAEHAVRES
jgi:small subunit ribosomal protein S2